MKHINYQHLIKSPTFNQIGWDRIRKNIEHTNDIKDIAHANNSIIFCNDMQVQLKGNKVITEMILSQRRRNRNNTV